MCIRDRLKAIHLNDSKNPFMSHKDRHEVIGSGSLGTEAMARIINHPSLKHLPFYLETPNELPGYAAEIALLRSLYQGCAVMKILIIDGQGGTIGALLVKKIKEAHPEMELLCIGTNSIATSAMLKAGAEPVSYTHLFLYHLLHL